MRKNKNHNRINDIYENGGIIVTPPPIGFYRIVPPIPKEHLKKVWGTYCKYPILIIYREQVPYLLIGMPDQTVAGLFIQILSERSGISTVITWMRNGALKVCVRNEYHNTICDNLGMGDFDKELKERYTFQYYMEGAKHRVFPVVGPSTVVDLRLKSIIDKHTKIYRAHPRVQQYEPFSNIEPIDIVIKDIKKGITL